ncbi:hypothetical protein MA16_Dca024500 [Dendrobium catenatum]|uniref:Uncharacterized protein n=1 Tax=Dendrobium catenatum TaxID=906689 RepID=A0A2I0VZ34_9ASPA|nr:hypothetical protein MA16_Dca024500 [Dendrobium catenatum]
MAADGRCTNLTSSESSQLRHLQAATDRQIEIDRLRRSRGELVISQRLPKKQDKSSLVEGKADLGGCTDNPPQAGREGNNTQQFKSSLVDKEISFADKVTGVLLKKTSLEQKSRNGLMKPYIKLNFKEKDVSLSEDDTCIEEGEILENEWDSNGLLDNPVKDSILMKQKAKKDTSTESSGKKKVKLLKELKSLGSSNIIDQNRKLEGGKVKKIGGLQAKAGFNALGEVGHSVQGVTHLSASHHDQSKGEEQSVPGLDLLLEVLDKYQESCIKPGMEFKTHVSTIVENKFDILDSLIKEGEITTPEEVVAISLHDFKGTKEVEDSNLKNNMEVSKTEIGSKEDGSSSVVKKKGSKQVETILEEEMDGAVDKRSSLKGGNKFAVISDLFEEGEIIPVAEDRRDPPVASEEAKEVIIGKSNKVEGEGSPITQDQELKIVGGQLEGGSSNTKVKLAKKLRSLSPIKLVSKSRKKNGEGIDKVGNYSPLIL